MNRNSSIRVKKCVVAKLLPQCERLIKVHRKKKNNFKVYLIKVVFKTGVVLG